MIVVQIDFVIIQLFQTRSVVGNSWTDTRSRCRLTEGEETSADVLSQRTRMEPQDQNICVNCPRLKQITGRIYLSVYITWNWMEYQFKCIPLQNTVSNKWDSCPGVLTRKTLPRGTYK